MGRYTYCCRLGFYCEIRGPKQALFDLENNEDRLKPALFIFKTEGEGDMMDVFRTIKRGETFAFYANITDDGGAPVIGLADKLRSQIRTSIDELVTELTVTESQVPGQYLFEAGPTDTWPVSTLYIDIRKDNNGRKTSSPTFKIICEKEVTKNV